MATSQQKLCNRCHKVMKITEFYRSRRLDKYPDGSIVPADHPLRHSYWLSFMQKRLELARNLLSDRGVIFISIDDNEQANLKLLCDQVFRGGEFVSNII